MTGRHGPKPYTRLKERRSQALSDVRDELAGWRPLPVEAEDEPLAAYGRERLGRRAAEGAGTSVVRWHARYTEWADALDWLCAATNGRAADASAEAVVGFGSRQVFAGVVVRDDRRRVLSGRARDVELFERTTRAVRDAAEANPSARLWRDLLERGLSAEGAARDVDAGTDPRRAFKRWAWRGGLGVCEDYPTRREADLRNLLRVLERSLAVPGSGDPLAVAGVLQGTRLPAALITKRVGPLVGRSTELSLFRVDWDATREGAARVVFVQGESGLGKSELAYEFATSIGDEGIVLASRPSMSGTRSQAELTELIRQVHGHDLFLDPGADLDEGELRALRIVLPDLFGHRESGQAVNPRGDRRALYDSLARVVRRAAAIAPLLIVVEDLHASTPDSLAAIGDLIEHRIPRTLIVATARMKEPGSVRLHRLQQEVAGARSRTLRLRPLTCDDVETLARAMVGGVEHPPDPPGLGAAIYERTGGHPFSVTTLLETWASSGSDVVDDPTRRRQVPEAVAEHMKYRVERLTSEERAILRTAAVIGDVFDVNLLAGALGRRVDAVLTGALGRLHDKGLLIGIADQPERLRFEHQLARDAVYEQLLPIEKARIHSTIADALHADYSDDDVAAYAHHCFEAARGLADQRRRSTEASIEAGRDSVARLAYEDAVHHFQRAVDHVPVADLRTGALARAGLGDALWRFGRLPEARAVLEDAASMAERLPDALLFARLATTLSLVAFQSNAADARLLALYERALATLPTDETYWRLRLMTAVSRELPVSERATRLPALAFEAQALDTDDGDPSSHAYSLLIRHDALLGEHNAERARLATQLVETATRARDPFLIFVGHGQQLYAALETLDLPRALDTIAACEDVGRRYRFLYASWHAALYRASLALFQEPLDEAERQMERATDIGKPLDYDEVRLMEGIQLAFLLRERGLGEAAGDIVRKGARDYGLPVWQAGLATGLCEIEGGAGAKDAKAVLARLEHAGIDTLPRDGTYPVTLSFLATAYAYLRDDQGAARLLPTMLRYRHRHPVIAGNATYWGSMNYHIGLVRATLGDYPGAITKFVEAYRDTERIRSPLWTAFTLVAHARTLRLQDAPGSRDNANRLIRRAAELATLNGYGRVKKEIEATGPTLIEVKG